LPGALKVLADGAADTLMIIDVETRGYLHFNDAAVRILRPLSRERTAELGAEGSPSTSGICPTTVRPATT